MMYANKMAVAIKSKGKVLREFKDTVYIPFASEYSILIKNLNTVRAIVNVYIDGDNAVPNGLVINAGQEVDLERWIKNNNLTEGNRFKFIERTANIEDHRGIGIEDGVIRVEYQFERVWPTAQLWSIQTSGYQTPPNYNTILRNSSLTGATGGAYTSTYSVNNVNISGTSAATPKGLGSASGMVGTAQAALNDTGITVPGSKSEQTFSTTSGFTTEPDKHTIVLKLLGETEDNVAITKPVTVKHKPKCVTCGKQNKATAKFCSACGTALEIFA